MSLTLDLLVCTIMGSPVPMCVAAAHSPLCRDNAKREASQHTEVASNWEKTSQDDREIQAMVGQGDWAVSPVPLGLFRKGSGRIREHCQESSCFDGPPQKVLRKEVLSL